MGRRCSPDENTLDHVFDPFRPIDHHFFGEGDLRRFFSSKGSSKTWVDDLGCSMDHIDPCLRHRCFFQVLKARPMFSRSSWPRMYVWKEYAIKCQFRIH